MKRIIALLLVLVFCLSLTACGNDSKPQDDISSSNSNQTENKEETNISDNTDINSDLPGVLSINLENVKYCVNSPSKQIYNKGYSFVNMENYFVVYDQYEEATSEFIYEVDRTKIASPADVIAGMEKQFISACSYGLINASSYEFDADYENVKINGWDMAKFIGTFELKYETDNPQVDYTSAKFVGYSLIKDNCPVYFVVVDIPSKGGEDNIEDIADKIAKTFREYSERS